MTTAEERSSSAHFGLKMDDAILDDESPTDGGTLSNFGTLKSEDSGIVLANGQQSPDEESKELVSDGRSASATGTGKKSGKNKKPSSPKTTAVGDSVNGRTGSRRRSSTETYTSDEDDAYDEDADRAKRRRRQNDGDATGGGAWLSDEDIDPAGKGTRGLENMETGEVESCHLNSAVGDGVDRPSVGSSPIPDCKGAKKQQPIKIEEPRVNFVKGTRCNDAIKAVEILKTRYRLADVVQREYQHRQWASSWGSADYFTRSYARNRSLYDVPEGSKQLKEICVAIERRHREIEEILRQLQAIEEANRAESEALIRLASVGDARLHSPGAVGSGSAANQSGTDAGRLQASDGGAGSAVGGGEHGASRPTKRRNPFRRAVTAIRKRFSRSEQPVPVAA